MAILKPFRGGRRRWGILFLALSVLMAGAQSTSIEYKVKAVYLVKFLQFVNWPNASFSSPDSPLVIGVLGADPFGRVLDETAEGEIIKNRRVVIRRYESIAAVDSPHVLYIGDSEKGRIPQILAAIKGRDILTVSDVDSFSLDGGIVRFLMENNRVHFRINVDASREANLEISSKLLQLAEIVHGKAAP